MKRIFLIFIIVLLFASYNGYGQQVGKRISHTTLSIFNNSDKDLNIKLGLSKENLMPYLIKSQEKWISPTFPLNSRPLLIIKTIDKEV